MSVFPTAWYRGQIVPTESLPIQPAWEPWGFKCKGVFTSTRSFLKHRCLALWPWHRARLVASSVVLDFTDTPDGSLDESMFQKWFESLRSDACIRVNMVANDILLPIIWAVAKPLPKTPVPTRLAISREPASDDRSLKRVAQEWRRRAETEADAKGVWDVVSLDSSGSVCDASKANILVRSGGRWITPPPGKTSLPGVVQGALLDHGLVEERLVTVDGLLAADEVVATNSMRGIVPIHEVEGRAFTPGDATKRLQEWFEKAAVEHAK